MTQKNNAYLIRILVCVSGILVASLVMGIVSYVLFMGVPYISTDIFSLHYTSENASIIPALVNTAIVLVISITIASLVGVSSAIFLTDYAKSTSPIVKVIALTAETLSGIPSIVYGLVGYMIFSVALGWQFSLLSGALTLSIMILPLVMRTSQEAILAVPENLRNGSLALGANKVRTLFCVVIPTAKNGIINGILLGSGRVLGESAALIYTAGTVAHIPKNLMGSGRTLSVHLYCLWSEGLKTESAFATAALLLIFCVLVNVIARKVSDK